MDAAEVIEYAITGEGPGISAEGQKALFTKFSRLAGPQSEKIAGTGLGFASCRLLAGLMDGTDGVVSIPGHGARFHLRLPLTAHLFPGPEPAGSAPTRPRRPCRTVLVVEDTDYNALATAAVLDKFGLARERVATGADALERFAAVRHDLVLLDRNLPDLDGTEVARRLRTLEGKEPRATVLAVTAHCTSPERTLFINAGMGGFVGKPLTPEKLLRVLNDVGRSLPSGGSVQDTPG